MSTSNLFKMDGATIVTFHKLKVGLKIEAGYELIVLCEQLLFVIIYTPVMNEITQSFPTVK